MPLSSRSPALALVGASLFATLIGTQCFIPSPAQAQKPKVSLNPAQFIDKSLEQCEKVLGKPAYVEGYGTDNKPADDSFPEDQTRYYKVPGVTRVVLTHSVRIDEATGQADASGQMYPTIGNLSYDFAPELAQTWQQAFRRIQLSTHGVKAERRKGTPVVYDLRNIPGGFEAVWCPNRSHAGEHKLLVASDARSRRVEAERREEAAEHKKGTKTDTSPAMSPVFHFKELAGRDFPAYERVLGKPASREIEKWDLRKTARGDSRTYKNRILSSKGIARITVEKYPWDDDKRRDVTYIAIVFRKGSGITWQQALAAAALPSQGVDAAADEGTINNKPYHSLILDGIQVPGIPMAKYNKDGKTFGVGWSATWYDSNPGEGDAPVLELREISKNDFGYG